MTTNSFDSASLSPACVAVSAGARAEKSQVVAPDPKVAALQRFALSITLFTIAGHLVLGFEQAPMVPVATVLVAYLTELTLEYVDAAARRRPLRFSRSPRSIFQFLLPAHITALACAMLLYAGAVLWPYLLATVAALTVKYVVKAPVAGRWRHVMNPSNFGIAVVLLGFHWVGIAPPYMFTANIAQPLDWIVPLAILMLGTALNVGLTKKWPLIAAWVIGFIIQAALRAGLADSAFLPAIAPLTGTAFILFTNYMITDPGTTPQIRGHQVIFGLTCAAVYGVLVESGVVYGLFFALVITCALRALYLWGRFAWDRAAAARQQPGRSVASGTTLGVEG